MVVCAKHNRWTQWRDQRRDCPECVGPTKKVRRIGRQEMDGKRLLALMNGSINEEGSV